MNRLDLRISKNVVNCDLENGILTIGEVLGYMPHNHLQGNLKDPFLFNHCFDNRFGCANFNLQ